MEMTPKELKRICRELQLYSTPELNDKIYLHFKGFTKIENLEPFTGLKVAYLEGNGFRRIEGLTAQKEMRCLYLQENQIGAIGDGVAALTDLDSLNLNQNLLTEISGLAPLTKLNTLLVQANKLKSLDGLRGLLECPSIGVLDLSKNEIEDAAVVEEILVRMPNLKVLYLKDNPVVSEIANYRKTLISSLPLLTYLDDRPVFEEERRTAEAWRRGGKKEEQEEREKIEREKRGKEERNYQAFENMMKEARQAQGITEEENDAAGPKARDEESKSDAEEDEEEQESKAKEAAERDAPPLDDAEADVEKHVVRPTAKITFTHTPSAAASSSGPLFSLATPATAAAAAVKPATVSTAKKTLIEVVDDEDEKVAPQEATPDRSLIQQLD